MSPQHIILIRHGQSEGNVDKKIYRDVPDYAIQLTRLGRQQARAAGKHLRSQLSELGLSFPKREGFFEMADPVMFYVSPLWRTRQTYQEIVKFFPRFDTREDARIREQEWGHLREFDVIKSWEAERDAFGSYYYRFEHGESGADVEDRLSSFLDTLHRDFERPDFPSVAVLVTHGFTMRMFLKRWFHWTPEQFEKLANPANCEMFWLKPHAHISTCQTYCRHSYDLVTKPKQYKVVRHPWQFPAGRRPHRRHSVATSPHGLRSWHV